MLTNYVFEFHVEPARLYSLVGRGGIDVSYTQVTSLLVNSTDRNAQDNEKFAKRILISFLKGLQLDLKIETTKQLGFRDNEILLTHMLKAIRKQYHKISKLGK